MQEQSLTGTSSATPASAGGGEIRLSFGFFYVVLKWGHERRSGERIDQDRRRFPALTATNLPVLAGVWTALFMAMYFVLLLGLRGLVYLFS